MTPLGKCGLERRNARNEIPSFVWVSGTVVGVLNELVALHDQPSAVRVDNGPEFMAQPFVD